LSVVPEVHVSDATLEAEAEAARAYEALFVPALFGQWASIVVAAAAHRGKQDAGRH